MKICHNSRTAVLIRTKLHQLTYLDKPHILYPNNPRRSDGWFAGVGGKIEKNRKFSESALLDPRIRPSARADGLSESGPASVDARGRADGATRRFQRRGTSRSAVRSRTVFGRRENMFAPLLDTPRTHSPGGKKRFCS